MEVQNLSRTFLKNYSSLKLQRWESTAQRMMKRSYSCKKYQPSSHKPCQITKRWYHSPHMTPSERLSSSSPTLPSNQLSLKIGASVRFKMTMIPKLSVGVASLLALWTNKKSLHHEPHHSKVVKYSRSVKCRVDVKTHWSATVLSSNIVAALSPTAKSIVAKLTVSKKSGYAVDRVRKTSTRTSAKSAPRI